MKKLMMVVVMCLAGAAAFAAQSEGVTQKGERCKREAAEGSKFCIGHADQAKKAEPKDKEAKTDSCWAVTEAGTRCKHKRDGESDYCKQHSPDAKPAKPFDQCRAMTYEGKQCSRKPVGLGRYCKQHGGK